MTGQSPATTPTGTGGDADVAIDARRALGAYGERCAVRHLVEIGLTVVARNWRTARGEIDIIAWEGDVLAICEVKTRRGVTFGTPAEAINRAKVRRLRHLAALWVEAAGGRPREIRFDVIAVQLPRAGPPRIEHLRDAF
jgi:putative endonuclease